MEIVVCIKQVPDTADVKIDPKTNTLIREGVRSIINPFDMYAIEEALRLKERFGGKVTVICMGPPQAKDALKEAISFGCDEAVLVSDRAFAGSDTLATSYTIASGIRKIGKFDLIICGKQASDGDTAQVGPGISVYLDVPQVAFVKKVEDVKDGKIIVERLNEEGFDIVESPLPCLITVVKEINTPRIASLKGIMRSKKYEVPTWVAADLNVEPQFLGLGGSPTQVMRIFTPKPRAGGQILDGSVDEAVGKLVDHLVKDLKS